jgi:hypothetical protein
MAVPKPLVICLAALLMAGCGDSSRPAENVPTASPCRDIKLVAVTPDNTHLWYVSGSCTGGAGVYFSSGGTQRTIVCGKNCTKQERVPAQ